MCRILFHSPVGSYVARKLQTAFKLYLIWVMFFTDSLKVISQLAGIFLAFTHVANYKCNLLILLEISFLMLVGQGLCKAQGVV